MKIAITGATGGLGRSVVEFLLKRNCEIVALGRNQAVGRELSSLGAQFQSGDVTDRVYLTKAFTACDVVVHSAGLASPWGDWESFYQSNVVGTQAVLEALRDANVGKLVHISTPSIYFTGQPREQIKETDPVPLQKTFYGRSKLMADDLVINETKKSDLSTVLIRPRAIIGKYDNAILPRILRVMERGVFPLANGGRALIDVTAVENVAQAIWLCINNEKRFRGGIFNITNDEPMPVKNLLARVAEQLGLQVKFVPVPMAVLASCGAVLDVYAKYISHQEPILSRYAVQSLGITQTLSLEKAKAELSYKPIISISDALANYRQLRRST